MVVSMRDKSHGLVSFSNRLVPDSDASATKRMASKPWVQWGLNNQGPIEILKLAQTIFSPQIIKRKVDFAMGAGIVLKKRTFVKGKLTLEDFDYAPALKWIEDSNFAANARRLFADLYTYGCAYPAFDFAKGDKVVRVTHNEATYMRCGILNANTGAIDTFYHCPNWALAKYDQDQKDGKNAGNVTRLAGFQTLHPEQNKYAVKKINFYTPNHPYYGLPTWWSGKAYMYISDQVPEYVGSAMANAYNFKYHIIVPESYFDGCVTDEEKAARRTELQIQLDQFSAGPQNAGKAFTSFAKRMDSQGWDKWEIIPLTDNSNSDSHKGLFNMSKEVIIASHGIEPSLLGLEATTKMNASGSEKRTAAQIHQKLINEERDMILDLLLWVRTINGWPDDLIFKFEDLDVVPLSLNQSGVQAAPITATA